MNPVCFLILTCATDSWTSIPRFGILAIGISLFLLTVTYKKNFLGSPLNSKDFFGLN